MGGPCSTRSIIDAKNTWEIPVKHASWGFGIGPAIFLSWTPRGPQLGPKLLPMGPTWGQVAPSWSQVGSKLGRSWGFGGWWAWASLQNVQITKGLYTFWRLARANMAPLQLKLYQSDRSAQLLPLLNYHTSAPSVRADFPMNIVALS